MGTSCSSIFDEDDDSDIDSHIVWQYKDDNNLWMTMDAAVNNTIEQAYKSKKKALEITSNYGFKYRIDFKAMTQTNTTSNKARTIRRYILQNTSIQNDKKSTTDTDYQNIKTHDDDIDEMDDTDSVKAILNDTSDDQDDQDDQDIDFMDQFESTAKSTAHIKYNYTEYKQEDAENKKIKIHSDIVGQSK
eukprot:732576_1